MADQIATVSKQRLKERAGRLEATDLRAVEHAIQLPPKLVRPYQPTGPSIAS
jgi:mRNA-degrading endonuclease toxin of MazEF toxin-antitoxin module